MIITAIAVILVISFLVFVHEFGHYLGARLVGVKVIEFSIGFPPKIFSKTIGGTEYMISLIPIGGFVRLLGQNIDDENPEEPGNYAGKSILQRLVIMVGGPLMNLVVALLFMPLVFWAGFDIPAYMMKQTIIESVTPGSDAEKAGIEVGDRLTQVDNANVEVWRDVNRALRANNAPVIQLTFERNGKSYARNISANLLSDFATFGWDILIDPVIGDIANGSAADNAGFKEGDRIVNIDDTNITRWGDISPTLQVTKGNEVSIGIIRESQNLTIKVTPEWNEPNQSWVIGVTSETYRATEPFLRSISLGFGRVVDLTKTTYEFLYRLVTGREKTDSVGGPIMIAQMVGQAAHSDLSSLIALVAFISLQFCVFNLLPIPALDGGHILFLLFEKIKGSALSVKFRLTAQKVGFSLLMTLILLISIQDTIRVFFK